MIGIIGGSGLYDIEGFSHREAVRIDTPFGEPSDKYITGRLGDEQVAFLPRHGEGHRLMPTEINFRANIYGFKKLGAEAIISASAVGSLREEYKPMDIVVPDQFYDRTYRRNPTFFGRGAIAHVSMADPVCPRLASALYSACQAVGATAHKNGTYICIEGPQFSTRAESNVYRNRGFDVIGMTNLQEAKLAREAEMCYTTMALVTDYDCWHEDEDDVTTGAVLEILKKNAATAKDVIKETVRLISQNPEWSCKCGNVLDDAFISDIDAIDPEVYEILQPIIGRVIESRKR